MKLHTIHHDVEYWEEEELLKIYGFKDISNKQPIFKDTNIKIFCKRYRHFPRINKLPLYKKINYTIESSKDKEEFEDKIYKVVPHKYHHLIKYYYGKWTKYGEPRKYKRRGKRYNRCIILPGFTISSNEFTKSYIFKSVYFTSSTINDFIKNTKYLHGMNIIKSYNNKFIEYPKTYSGIGRAYDHYKKIKRKLEKNRKKESKRKSYSFFSTQELYEKSRKERLLRIFKEDGLTIYNYKKWEKELNFENENI